MITWTKQKNMWGKKSIPKTLLGHKFMNRQPIKWKKIFTNYISDKELISKIHKEPLQLNNRNNPIQNWQRAWTGIFPKIMHERCSTSSYIRETWSKTTMKLTPTRILETGDAKCWWRWRDWNFSALLVGIWNGTATLEKQFGSIILSN